MTCIVALKDPETRTVYMGCDTRVTHGNGLCFPLPENASKVFDTAGFLFGESGAAKIRGLVAQLKIKFGPDGPSPDFNLEQELYESLSPFFKAEAKKRGYVHEKEGLTDFEGTVLIAFGGQICVLVGDFSVLPIEGGFWAIGSGQRLALGSLATSEGLMPPLQRVEKALLVASIYENSVAPPFVIKQTTPIPLKRG